MRTLAQAFDEFTGNLNVKTGSKEMVHKREKRLREALLKDPCIKEVFISGSFARGTAIHPLNDVDLFVVMAARPSSPFELKQQLEKLIRPIYREEIYIRPQSRSLGIRFQDTPFDIVPAINHEDPNGGYWIADNHWNWLRTNPKKHKDFVKRRSQETWQMGIPLVKMLKCWNRTHDLGLKSFHLETLVLKAINQKPASYVDGCERLFRSIKGPLANPCKDSAKIGDLADYLKHDHWKVRAAQQRCDDASKLLAEAIKHGKAGNISQALANCRVVFGHPFPG